MAGCKPEPIETCPKIPDVPYVLLVKGIPVVASWSLDGWAVPTWSLWLGTGNEQLGADLDVQGWFPLDLPPVE